MNPRGEFTGEQVERLLRPIRPSRVFHREGQSHVAGWDVSAHLTRMFGFGRWEKEILRLDLVSEHSQEKNGRTGWWVTYRCTMRLRVFDLGGVLVWENDDAATGSASNLPQLGDAHDFAMKNSVTYALKRCAKDLGDQFGLSLYNKGQTGALVGITLVGGPAAPGEEPDVPVTGEHHDSDPVDVPEVDAPQSGADRFRELLAQEDVAHRATIKAAFIEEFGDPLSALPEARMPEAIAWLKVWLASAHESPPK